jgi:hypothetical protein
VVTEFSPKQEGSGDPSPSNIRPLSGWDKLNLNAAGKNLLLNTATTQNINGVTFTVNADGTVTANGTASDIVFFNVGRAMLERGAAYTLSGCPAGGNNGGSFLMYLSIGSEFYYDFGSSVSFEGAGEAKTVFIQVKSGATVNATFRPMIRLASVPDATYASYTGNLHTLQIGQTVYGGRVDWTKGEMVAAWAMVTLTGVENWVNSSSASNAYYIGASNNQDLFLPGFDIANDASAFKHFCSHYKEVLHPNTLVNNAFDTFVGSAAKTIRFKDDRFSSVDRWVAHVKDQYASGTPIQLVMKLATPTTIQLPATEIIALPGTNTLYGDGDTITVTGRQPQTNALETRLAALEAAMTNV